MLRSILAEEGLTDKNAEAFFDTLSVSSDKLAAAILSLPEGTLLKTGGKISGRSVEGGYAMDTGRTVAYVRINQITGKHELTNIPKSALKILASL